MKTTLAACLMLSGIAVATAACAGDPTAAGKRHLEKGDRYAQAGKYREAAIEYRNAIKMTPRSVDAHAKLAETAARTNDPNTAAVEYLRLADLDPANPTAQIKAASIELLAGRYGDARERAEAAIRHAPKDANGYIALGEALAGLHEARRSRESLAEAVRLAPQSPDAHVALASAYWAEGRRQDAEDELNRAIQIAPEHAGANRALGLLDMATGRDADAEARWTIVARVPGGDPFAIVDYYAATGRLAASEHELLPLAGRAGTREAAAVRLAAIQYARGDHQSAYSTLDRLLKTSPKNVAALLVRAQLLLADGKPDAALAAANAAMTPGPTLAPALTVKGAALAAKGDNDRALQALDEAAKLNPASASANVAIARIRLKQGRVSDAIAAVEKAKARQPGDYATTVTLVDALIAGGEGLRAEAEAKAGLEKWPRAPELYTRLGGLQLAQRRTDEAQRTYTKALELQPSSPAALAGRTAIDIEKNRGSQALARVDAQLNAHPREPALMLLSAQASAAAGDKAKAESTLKVLIQIDPNRLEAFASLGSMYLKDGRLEEARDQFTQAAKYETNPSAATMVGMILEAEGRRADARVQYEQTVAKFPRAGIAANNLAWIYLSEDRLDDAIQWATVAREEMPRRPEVNDTLGWAYLRRREPSQAVPLLAEAAEMRKDNPTYHYHLGVAYAQTGLVAKAREELTRAVGAKSGFSGREDAVRLLKALASAAPADQRP